MFEFEEIFKKYYRSLVLYAVSFVDDEKLAEDIVQSLFVKLWNNNLFSSISSHQSYLYNATRNACIDYIRSKKNLIPISDYVMEHTTPHASELTAEKEADDERVARLYKIVDNFPRRCKEVFFKVCIEGMSYAEASLYLGISPSMVKKQIVKAYKIIREKYKFVS